MRLKRIGCHCCNNRRICDSFHSFVLLIFAPPSSHIYFRSSTLCITNRMFSFYSGPKNTWKKLLCIYPIYIYVNQTVHSHSTWYIACVWVAIFFCHSICIVQMAFFGIVSPSHPFPLFGCNLIVCMCRRSAAPYLKWKCARESRVDSNVF